MSKIEKDISQTRPFRNVYHKASVNLIFTGKWIINLHSGLFKHYGISLQQYNILRILKGRYPKTATIKSIKKRMLDKMSDASRIVEILNKKGLISRTLNAEDRRKVDVKILQKGLDLLEEIESQSEKMDNFLSNLNEEEIEQLNFLLDKARG